jgi:hypothetical protein
MHFSANISLGPTIDFVVRVVAFHRFYSLVNRVLVGLNRGLRVCLLPNHARDRPSPEG